MKPGELIHGEIGSNQYLAYRIRLALNPIEIFPGICIPSVEERQWAIDQLAKAWNDYDLDFLRDQTDGLEKLRLSDPTTSRDPRLFFVLAFNFLCRTKETLPFRTETISLTERIWAITRLKQKWPELPLPRYKPDFERKIKIEIDKLPKQKWSRIYQLFGLKFSKAKRGPNPKSK